jgi:hypothetical protein
MRDHGEVRMDVEAVELAGRLAVLLEAGRVTRLKAGHVRVDRADVADLVHAINRATGTQTRRDWRGRITVTPESPLAEAADAVRRAVENARRVPFTDDVVLPYSEAQRLAENLRRPTP